MNKIVVDQFEKQKVIILTLCEAFNYLNLCFAPVTKVDGKISVKVLHYFWTQF